MNLQNLTTSDFVKALAAGAPAPGGGSAAAFAGAMAAGLCAMVASLTTGKARYRDAWKSMDTVIAAADRLAEEFLRLMDADTDAYNGVVAAFKLPKESEALKSARARAVQEATRRATEVPLATLKAAAAAAPLAAEVISRGNRNCLTDAGSAVLLLRTAAMAAAYNVRVNLLSLEDADYVAACRQEVDRLSTEVISQADRMAGEVAAGLGDGKMG
jgi:formiminotetrahydrofolate cyclodeaminase